MRPSKTLDIAKSFGVGAWEPNRQNIDVRSGHKGLYQTTLYPGVLLDAASDLKLLASERWERERYRDLWAGQFPQLHLFEKRPIRTLARELIR